MTAAVKAFHAALTQEADLGELLTFDVVWEDLALRSQVIGRSAVGRMVGQSLGLLPFGRGARIRHIVSGPRGGGYEWLARPGSPIKLGITALELGDTGRIARVTVVYDGRHLAKDTRRELLDALAD